MTRPPRASAGAWGLAFAIAILLVSSPPSGADPGEESALYAQTTAARTARRLGPLARSPELEAIARRHALALAAGTGPAFHNPGLRAETAGWRAIGEVVGRVTFAPGWDSRLIQLWLNSTMHRQVLLSGGFTVVGIGTARSPSGVITAVEVFGRSSGAPPPPRPSRQRSPVGRPQVEVPPTTSPPTTTAPLPPPPPTTTSAPPTTLAPTALPRLTIAAGPTAPRSEPVAGATAMLGLLACCAGLGRAVRRRPKR